MRVPANLTDGKVVMGWVAMEVATREPTVFDGHGQIIRPGVKVWAGEGESGTVTRISDHDGESYRQVYVDFPDCGEDYFVVGGTGWMGNGPEVCDDVEVVG